MNPNATFTNSVMNQVENSYLTNQDDDMISSNLNSSEEGHLPNNSYVNSNVQIVNNYMPVSLPSPTYDLLHHQAHLQSTKDHHHHHHQHHPGSNMQIYETNAFNSNAHLMQQQSSLPVLTPLNLNLKYVEYQDPRTNCVLSSGSDSESLNDHSRIRAKKSLPHKKRLKKLNSEQFSTLINMPEAVQSIPQFECTECFKIINGQLDFFMHLKEHYEPIAIGSSPEKLTRSRSFDVTDVCHNIHQNQIEDENNARDVPENLIIESLEDSQDDIKMEEMNGDAFEFSEPEDMEDFRKEVAKVVETIEENPDSSSWTYQVSEEISENQMNNHEMNEHHEMIDEEYNSDKNEPKDLSQHVVNDESSYLCSKNLKDTSMLKFEIDSSEQIVDNLSEDDEEDNRPLNEVKFMLKRPGKECKQKSQSNVQDKEEMELNECLKKINNFKCNIPDCNKTFNSRTALGYHLKTHNSERRFVCDQCGKKFLTNGALKVHLRLHSNERPYQCNHCEKSFRQWGDLRYHETSIHSNEKNHICEFCAKSFARKYSLVIHRRIHTGERNYKCTDCDKSFRASSYLVNHQRIHTGEKPHECKVCQKRFRVQGDLKRHMKIHDRVKGSSLTKEIKKPADDEKLVTVKEEVVENLSITKKTKKSLKRKNKST